MRVEDRDTIISLIDRMKTLSGSAMERASADLKTVVMMAAEPEIEFFDNHPVIIQQGGRTYRAMEIC